MSFSLFGHIIGLFLSVFSCDLEKKKSFIDNTLECRSGFWFILESILTIICLICFIYISYITNLIFYIPNFIFGHKDILKKTTSIPEIILFITKIVFVIIFNFSRDDDKYQWFLLFIFFIFAFANIWSIFHYNHFENKILMKLNKCLSLILLWSIICLFIGKIFQNWNYNGTLYLFFFGAILIIFFFIFHKDKANGFYTLDFKLINSGEGRLKYIQNFLNLIKMKDKGRNNFIIFNTLVLLREENCINKNCKLKKYLQLVEKGYKTDYILYEYCQQLFEMSIKLFPNDIILKANYVIYLVVQMSKKKLAKKVLSTMKTKFLCFENNYILFCCKKYIETYSPGSKKFFEENNKNILKTIEYDRIYNKFRDDILKSASLYYEFWSSLYKSHLQGTEDFIKLNNIGKKINSLNDIIEENYQNLHNVKSDDFRVINLYSGYLQNILNKIKKYKELKDSLISLSNIDKYKVQEKEIDYSNFDLNILNKSDEYKYIISSAEEETIVNILNISLNFCEKFGYNKNELIGKKVTIFFPEIYRNIFINVVSKYSILCKTKFYDLLSQKKEYNPEFFEYFIDGITKSKHLIPLYIKTYYVQTEESDHIFVNELLYEEPFINKINQHFHSTQLNTVSGKESNIYDLCVILTDLNFKIQTFSPNCQELLGLNSYALNSNIDVTSFIEEFKEEFDKVINDEKIVKKFSKYEKKELDLLNFVENFKKKRNSTFKSNDFQNHISTDQIILYKRYIAEKKYCESKLIKWKIYDLIQVLMGNQNNGPNIAESFRNQKEKKNINYIFNNYENEKERQFLLIIKKAMIYDHHTGYKFFFKREKIDEYKNNTNNCLMFKLKKDLPQRKSNVGFKSLIQNNDKIEGSINNSRTAKLKHFIKMSNSLRNQKKEEDFDGEYSEVEKSIKSIQFEELKNENHRQKSSTSLKKKNLKNLSRYSSSNDIQMNTSQNITVIDEDYIPTNDFNFYLDLDSLSFKPLYTLIKAKNNFSNILKNKAMVIIKQFQTKNNPKKQQLTFSSYNSSYDDNDSFESEEESSSFSSNSEKEKEIKRKEYLNYINEKEKQKGKHKEDNIKEEIAKEYYRVSGLNKIKFMEYDFEQEMVVFKGVKKEIKSEVENIITNFKLSVPTNMDEESDEHNYNIKKYISKGNLEKEKYKLSSANLTNLRLKNQKKNYNEETNTKVENALKNIDKEKLIVILYILLILFSIILLIFSGYLLYFILSTFNKIKDNILLLIYSVNLRHFTNLGIYYSREITISSLSYNTIDNKKIYYPIYEDQSKYLEKQEKKLKEAFLEGHRNMELMMGMNFELDKNNSYYLNIKPFQTSIQYDLIKTRIITSTLLVSIVQVYSHFYHLIIFETSLNYGENSFNFISNAMNSLADGLEDVIKIYFSEIKIKYRANLISSIILIVFNFIIHIAIYYSFKRTYLEIIYRKERYIFTFYEINLSFIQSSMLKCEKFIKKINPNELVEIQEKNESYDNSMSSNFEGEFIFNNESNNRRKNKSIKMEQNLNENKIKFNEASQIKIFTIKLVGIILFSFLFINFVIWRFIIILNNSKIMGLYIYKIQHYHNNIINLWNAYREFIYVNNAQMHNLPIFEFLFKAEKELYETLIPDLNEISDKCKVIKGLCKMYREIQRIPYCSENYNDEIKQNQTCNYYTEITTSLGFFNFISFFIEEIRIKRNYILLLDKLNNLVAMTLDNIDQFQNRTINYFNEPEIHPDVNFMFINIILPIMNKQRNKTAEIILDEINSKHLIYTMFLVLYFIIVFVADIFFWNPLIIGIKTLIYKTKYLLTIIPVEILVEQTNIKNLLGITDLNE